MGERNDTAAVGTTAVIASARQDGRRTLLYIRNISTGGQVITVSNGVGAVANYGIVLNPNEYYADSKSEGYVPFQGTVSIISSAAAGAVSIYERISEA